MAPVAVYSYNACEIRDFDNYITITTPYKEVYKFSKINGKYCYTFPGLFLNKYKHVYYNRIYEEDVIECLAFASAPYIDADDE